MPDVAILTRAAVVTEARTWIGVPFRHQGYTRDGVDCIGLLSAVVSALGMGPADPTRRPGAEEFRGYARQPSGASLLGGLHRCAVPIPVHEAQPADIIVVDWGMGPQHVGWLADYRHGGLSLIHALSRGAGGSVVEHRLTGRALSRPVAAFSVPGVG